MKKLIFMFLFVFSFYFGKSQSWSIDSAGVMIYKSPEINLQVTENMFFVSGIEKTNILLYDSIGHYVESFNLEESKDKTEIYKAIYKFLRYSDGWIRVGKTDIPTLKRRDE